MQQMIPVGLKSRHDRVGMFKQWEIWTTMEFHSAKATDDELVHPKEHKKINRTLKL